MEYNFDKINLKNCNIKSGTIEDANNILKLIKLIQPKEYWSIITSIITLILGYLFGKK